MVEILVSKRTAAGNMGLAIAGVQWLIEVLCFYFTFVLADSFVLRNARHRQAPNRWQKPFQSVSPLDI